MAQRRATPDSRERFPDLLRLRFDPPGEQLRRPAFLVVAVLQELPEAAGRLDFGKPFLQTVKAATLKRKSDLTSPGAPSAPGCSSARLPSSTGRQRRVSKHGFSITTLESFIPKKVSTPLFSLPLPRRRCRRRLHIFCRITKNKNDICISPHCLFKP